MALRVEFKRRLFRLNRAIERALQKDDLFDLLPKLFSVYSFIWSNKKLIK